MSPSKAYVVLAALLVAGCASAPEVADEAPAAAPAVAATASPGTVVPDTVLDANELIAHTPAAADLPRRSCEELERSSDAMHERRGLEALGPSRGEEAQPSSVRMMQGGAYR